MDEDELLARALEVLQRRAAARSAPGLTVRQLYAAYEAAYRTSKSWDAMRVRLAAFIESFGDRPVQSLEVLDWSQHSAARLATAIPGAKDGRCYCKRTVNAELGWAKAMFSWAVGEGRIKYNPIAAAKRLKGVPKGRQTAPREHEIALLLEACSGPRQTVMVLAACDVGMRRGEILALRHDWIDHEAKTVALPNHACKNAKGGVVPVTQRFLDAVGAVPRHIRYPFVLWGDRGAKKGGQLSRGAINAWWRDVRERAGVQAAPGDKAVRLHDGRAACATNAVERGVRLKTVSKRILRHASLRTTEIYLRRDAHDPDETAEASAIFERGIIAETEKRKGPKRANVDFDAPAPTEHLPGRSGT